MKEFENYAAQGDLMIVKVDNLPEGCKPIEAENSNHIVAHSETGHHHVMPENDIDLFQSANDPLAMFAVVKKPTQLKHLRSFDTHETIGFNPGTYMFLRQQEGGLRGRVRQVMD